MDPAWPMWLAQAAGEVGAAGAAVEEIEALIERNKQVIVLLYATVFFLGLAVLVTFNLVVQRRPLAWDEPVRRLLNRPWTGRRAAWIAVPLAGLQLLFSIGYGWWLATEPEPGGEQAVLIVQSLLFHWMCLGLIAGVLVRAGLGWTAAFGRAERRPWWREAGWGAMALLGIMPLILGYNVVAQLVMDWLDMQPPVQDVTRIIALSSGWTTRLYLALLAVVIAPVVEEMLFRGVLLPALANRVGVKPAIVVVSLLFALVHGHLPALIPLFMLSVILSLLYLHRGTLVAPVAMHSLFNSLTVAVLFLP